MTDPIEPMSDFPTHVLPPWIRDLAEEATESLCLPGSSAPHVLCGMVATAYHAKAEVRVLDQWIENTGLYSVLSMDSGGGKSPLMRIAGREIERHEIAEGKRRREYADRVEQIKPSTTWPKALKARAMPPSVFLMNVADVTMEALERDLSEMNEALSIVTAEGMVIEKILGGVYSNRVADASTYCRGWSGESIVTSRITRERVVIRQPSLSSVICAQPHVVRAIIGRPEHQDQGVVGRMLLHEPESNIGRRSRVGRSIAPEVVTRFEQALSRVLSAPHREPEPWEDDIPDLSAALSESAPPWYHGRRPLWLLEFDGGLGEQAKEVQAAFEPELMETARLGSGADLVSWGAKAGSHWARLAVLHHVASNPDRWYKEPIRQASCDAAFEMVRFYFGEVMRIVAAGSKTASDAKILETVERACRSAAKERKGEPITPGVIRSRANIGRGRVKTPEECDQAIRDLIDEGTLIPAQEAKRIGRSLYRYVPSGRIRDSLS